MFVVSYFRDRSLEIQIGSPQALYLRLAMARGTVNHADDCFKFPRLLIQVRIEYKPVSLKLLEVIRQVL